MATLFERLVNPPTSPGPNESKIPIHGLRELMREFVRDEVTAQQAQTVLDLNASQFSDLQAIGQKAAQSANKESFFDMFFGILVLGEIGILPTKYRDETEFWNRVNNHG